MASKRLSRYIPHEHGAWAMLIVPFALGTFSATPSWPSLLLLVAWLAVYLTSYFGLRWWKTRTLSHRGVRFRAPTLLYASLLAVSGAILLVLEPWLVFAGIAFLPFESTAVALAIRGKERSLPAGFASATAACLMAPVAYRLADGDDWTLALTLFVVSWLAFTGSVLHVKSTIRERDDPRYRTASIAFHALALIAATWIKPLLVIPFGFLLVRAVVVPRHGWRPAQIGAVEIAGSLLVLAVPLVAL